MDSLPSVAPDSAMQQQQGSQEVLAKLLQQHAQDVTREVTAKLLQILKQELEPLSRGQRELREAVHDVKKSIESTDYGRKE